MSKLSQETKWNPAQLRGENCLTVITLVRMTWRRCISPPWLRNEPKTACVQTGLCGANLTFSQRGGGTGVVVLLWSRIDPAAVPAQIGSWKAPFKTGYILPWPSKTLCDSSPLLNTLTASAHQSPPQCDTGHLALWHSSISNPHTLHLTNPEWDCSPVLVITLYNPIT